MWEHELPISRVDEAVRVVRALGKHRYVAGRMHFVHALAACDLPDQGELATWAREIVENADVDKTSRDERLVRRVGEDELCAVLDWFWNEETAGRAGDALLERMERFDVDVVYDGGLAGDDVFPLLVDAGWELLPLAELDPERHRGAIDAFGERIHFDVAQFEEQEHLPPVTHLQELSAMGVSELVRAAAGGELALPFSLWLGGNAIYQDYVLRGVLRAAKIATVVSA